jgi:two-component system, OmpR family, sensor histidine kinase BaeS
MLRSLHLKFLILLIGVVLVALSGTLILRGLMLKDFADYLEGDAEDRVYALLADFEGAYERDGGWKENSQAQLALWALTLGFEINLRDDVGRVVTATDKAITEASPALKRRLIALSQSTKGRTRDLFTPYPLFLAGNQIGTLELRTLKPAKEALFVRRADRFLLLSMVVVGGLAVIASILFSNRLTSPVKELALAASAISRGNLGRRVTVARRDELGDLADAFNRMADALETQESLRRKLIADVAHELRTPLGVMRGEIEGIIDGLIPNDEKRLQSLYDETGRLKRMVEGIEELNQAETSALNLNRQMIRLKPFFENIADRFGAAFRAKGILLVLRCPDDIELYGDPERLSQIVVNLLSNALAATDSGGRVTLRAESGGDSQSIIVEDTGNGIKEEALPFVFERFYKGPGGGLGIGLTIVKELVEAHGGKVHVKSTQGKGSSFTASFPPGAVHNSS